MGSTVSTQRVFRGSHRFEVIWPHAISRVAQMVERQVFRNAAVCESVRVSVCTDVVRAVPEGSVSTDLRSCEEPALSKFWAFGIEESILDDLRPEPLLSRQGAINRSGIAIALHALPMPRAIALAARWGLASFNLAWWRLRAAGPTSLAASIRCAVTLPAEVVRAAPSARGDRLTAVLDRAFGTFWVLTDTAKASHALCLS